jgi:hypothetical protein
MSVMLVMPLLGMYYSDSHRSRGLLERSADERSVAATVCNGNDGNAPTFFYVAIMIL